MLDLDTRHVDDTPITSTRRPTVSTDPQSSGKPNHTILAQFAILAVLSGILSLSIPGAEPFKAR